jgi:CRP/FNR family transcriptional regulator, polysaccharide utilization system transcription regulator
MKKLLLIEDNPDVRENSAEILTMAGYSVRTAENGKIGVELVKAERPDLIVCDIMMPVLDGFGVLQVLSMSEETAAIPFIFLTAKTERSDIRKGMEMGADDYLTKPFDDVELLKAVESRLNKVKQRQQDPFTASTVEHMLGQLHGLEDIATVAKRTQVKHFKKREVIFTEGDSPQGLYYLRSGKVKLFKSHELGKDLITHLLQPGDFFGYLSLLQNTPYNQSAETIEESEVVMYSVEDFLHLITASQQTAEQFIKLLVGNVQKEHERLLALAYSSVRKRTAEALLTLKNRYHTETDRPFGISISRDDLAKLVGTATESLIRTISDFKEEGLIQVNASNITIVNVKKLEQMRN